MDIGKLEVGLVVKSYKAMCKLLEEEEKDGNSKIAQLEEWKRYFDWDKKGHSFTIKTIYAQTKPKILNKNKLSYIDNLEKLMLDLMANYIDKDALYVPKFILFKELRMINPSYIKAKSDKFTLSRKSKINLVTIEDFFTYTDDMLENNLETALNRLKSKKLIDKYIIKLIYGKDENNNFKYREATNEDLKLILKEERNAMLELDCKNMQQICAKGLWGEMQQIVLRYLKPYGIDSYYNCYKLIVNKEAVQDVIETEYNAWRLNKEQKEENLQTVNNAVIERIYHNMIKRKERTIKEYNKYFESELISATPLDKWEKIKLSAKHALQTNPKYEEYFCTLSSALITQSDMNKSFITNFIDFDE